MPNTGDTIISTKTGRDYLVCSVTALETVLRSADGLVSIVWTRDVVNAIQDGKFTRKPD